MALKCNACGGKLFYDVGKNKLVCEFCSNEFDVASYQLDNKAEVISDGSQLDTYMCKNCGAMLNAPTEQLVAYCNYCGSESMELSKTTVGTKPVKMVPFMVSAEEARRKYKEYMWKKFAVPKEFTDEKFLSEFRGIYIPYWATRVDVSSPEFNIKATKDYTKGSYDYHEEYDIRMMANGDVDGGYYDASEAFDDTVAAEIAPYESTPIDFNEGYLAGFYADAVTANEETYKEVAIDQAVENIANKVSKSVNDVKIDQKDLKSKLTLQYREDPVLTFLPVWFLTWKKGNRVAYSVMNGNTGKLSADVPVDFGRITACVAKQFVIYFVLLCLLPIFIVPLGLASMTSALTYFSSFMLCFELKTIYQKEQHVFDLGDEKHNKKKIQPGKQSAGAVIFGCLWLVCLFFIGKGGLTANTPSNVQGFILLFVLIQLICTVRSLIRVAKVQKKTAIFAIIFSLIAQIIGVVLSGKSHPEDYWYYTITIINLCAFIFNMVMALSYINQLATRPVPNFFEREGGKHA